MRTLVLQLVLTLLLLAFGVAALLISRHPSVATPARGTWFLTGVTFLAYSVSHVAQNVAGTWAFVAGKGTRVWDTYLQYAPVANHSRTFEMFAFCLAMLVYTLVPRMRAPAGMRILVFGIVAGLFVGGYYGWLEGGFSRQTHYTAVAVLDVVELLLLLSTLFAMLVNNTADRLLWFALGAHSFSVALNILWMLGLRSVGVGWAPAPVTMAAYRAVLAAVVVSIAVTRLRRARLGIPV
ncbi:MAG TPA: hypothetical protein VE913_02335, partial [Longimicrobium sp.]|nr:hypothetical protein [Longimicrobium sp.]